MTREKRLRYSTMPHEDRIRLEILEDPIFTSEQKSRLLEAPNSRVRQVLRDLFDSEKD